MKSVTIYICEKCGNESRNENDIIQCEANHLGLTINEYGTWKQLKMMANKDGVSISYIKNETTEKEFDTAINNLIEFETSHNIPKNLDWK